MRKTISVASIVVTLAIIINLLPLDRRAEAQSSDEESKHRSIDDRTPEAAFTPGNLVIYRVGDGGAALTSAATAVFLDEYTPAGGLVQSIAMPTAVNGANKRLTASGTATSEGFIGRSNDGQYLVLAGYDADLLTASITSSTSAAINRVIGRIGANGVVDTTTALTDAISGGNPRGVATTNGTDLWIAGTSAGGGIRYALFGATTSVSLGGTPTNLRVPGIFGGQLYVSTSSGTAVRLGTVGTGTPTTEGQTITNLPGFPASVIAPYQYHFADLSEAVAGVDTLYVTEDASAPNGGVAKYSLVGGNWVSNGLITLANTRALAASVSGTNVILYVTAAGTTLQTAVDSTGYNVAPTATFTSIATAGTNTAFRGVAFAPQAAGGNPGTLAFDPAGGGVFEGDGFISLFVKRTGGTTGTVGVSYSTPVSSFMPEGNPPATGGDSCATPGVDYVTTSGTLTFVNGDDTEHFNVIICDDSIFEQPDEVFTAIISNATGGATIGVPAAASVSIIDDDTAPPVSVSGRITTSSGRSIANARIVLYSNAFGVGFGTPIAVANSSTFGYFTLFNIPTGATYTVTVSKKGYVFATSPANVPVNGAINDLNFVANP